MEQQMTLEKSRLEQLDKISPNLKLGSKHLIPVLEGILEGQPRRVDVKREVMDKFESKNARSVFRGMVIPTTKRLELTRVDARKEVVELAPNGKLALSSETTSDRRANLSKVIRDYAVLKLEQTRESIEYLEENKEEIKSQYPDIEEKASRFNRQYLRNFDVELPSEDVISEDSVVELYKHDGLSQLLFEPSLRKEWLESALHSKHMVQMDDARWALMKDRLKQGTVITSWMVDEAIWREWKSENNVIDLWEASTHSPKKLVRRGTSYEAVVLKGT